MTKPSAARVHTRVQTKVLLGLVAFATVVLCTGCVKNLGVSPLGPRGTCAQDSDLMGVWQNSAHGQTGQNSSRLEVTCDCTYRMKVKPFKLMAIKESGPVSIAGDQLTLERANGTETTWKYQREGDELLLWEGDPEPKRYVRTKEKVCE